MYCINCGHELPDDSEFCPYCSFSFESDEEKEPKKVKTESNKLLLLSSVIASVILIISVLLPFVSITFLGTKIDAALIQGDGIFFIVIAIISLSLSFIKKYIGVIISGLLSISLSIFEAYNITHKEMNNDSDLGFDLDYSAFIHKEIGFYLMFLGSILILAVGIYGLLLKKGSIANKK